MRYFLFLLFATFSFGQQSLNVDFISMNGRLTLNENEKSVLGLITYQFNVLKPTDTIKIDAQKMEFLAVLINGKDVKYLNTGSQLVVANNFKLGLNTITINFYAYPKKALYFIGKDNDLQIWTQGQGKYTSNWLPSFDDVNEKVIFNLSILLGSDFEVISNGKLASVENLFNGKLKMWNYQMQKPMSSYLLMIAIGKFEKTILKSKLGIPIELYLKPDDKNKFESTYKYSKEIFNFLEKEIGIKYPWEIYRQTPLIDFLYAGMENASSTLFSQDYVVDEIGFNDRNYINVNAHELAHQWFGDLVTAKTGEDHWLQEGFATYYALLTEKEIFGEDHFNFEMLKMANELEEASKTDLIPILNEKASSLSFYQKGAWALFVLSENIGYEKFKKAVKNYLKKHEFKNVTTDDFLLEIKKISNYDVENFKKIWLEKSGFETSLAINILSKNKSVKQLFDLQKMYQIPFEEKKTVFEKILKSDAFFSIKQEVILQLVAVSYEQKKELLNLAMQSNDFHIRQVIAETMTTIPEDFKPQYESLLEDKSYNTREIALSNLCKQFPNEVTNYLNLSKAWVGFNNKNLRISWLSIALKNPDYEAAKQTDFKNELITYCSTNYDSYVRQNALEALLITNPENENVLLSLVNATTHHKWQFVKFGKDSLRILIKNEKFRKIFQNIMPKLSEKEAIILNNLLKE